ncbi:DUF1549 domain-containing protein [soil metagenome]
MKRTRLWLLSAGLIASGTAMTFAADEKKADVSKSDVPAKAAEPAKAEAVKEFATPTDAINHFIREGYKKAKITAPAAKATDDEFMRRAFIDLIGRVATYEEVMDYEADNGPNKRARLVNRLLYGVQNKDGKSRDYFPKVNGQAAKVDGKPLAFDYPDLYAQNWANLWTVWLMTRTGHPVYRDQMRTKLEELFLANVSQIDFAKSMIMAKGKSNEDGRVNFIIHHLGEPTAADKRSEVGPFDAVPITSRVTRLFLGVQTNCTQCHDHPFNKEWTQADFWGVNAFFRQTLRDRTPTGGAERRGMENPVQVELHDDNKYNNEQIIFYERRDGKLMASKPNFLKDLATAESGEANHKPIGKSEAKSRREVLAEYVTKHDNFAKSYVNRIWGHLFGRGLNKEGSVDDFGSHNEVMHPEMLDYLAGKFVEYNYDSKKLLEWICTSEVYSLSHVANPAYADTKYDAYFARMPLKALAPEVLYESIMTVTKADFAADKDLRKKNKQDFEAKLVRNFGDDEGNEMSFNGTVVQALLMMNGREINEEINRKTASNPVSKIIAKHSKGGAISSNEVITELFQTVLNRKPTSTEFTKINAVMTKGAVIPGEKKSGTVATPAPAPVTPPKGVPGTPGKGPNAGKGKNGPAAAPIPEGPRAVNASGPNDPTFYQDLFWALLNTNEFMLNH